MYLFSFYFFLHARVFHIKSTRKLIKSFVKNKSTRKLIKSFVKNKSTRKLIKSFVKNKRST
jgi:hypothetical protein